MDGDRILTALPGVAAHQEQTRNLVRAMMTLAGETASGLAKAAGLTPSTLNRFMHKPVRHTLSQSTMLALMTETFRRIKTKPKDSLNAEALSALGPAIAIYEQGIVDLAPDVKRTIEDVKSGPVGSPRRTLQYSETSVAELPVLMTTTLGIDIDAGNFTHAPLTTARPPFLEGDANAFAILMPDESMAPRFDAGDMLYVSPARMIEGDRHDVVIARKQGGYAIGTLTATTSDSVRIATLQPRSRQTYPRDKIRGLYRIVGVQRLGG